MSTRATTTPDTTVARGDRVTVPQSGDVVVSADSQSPGHFTIRQVPGNPTALWGSRAEALEIARGFACAHAVDVWVQQGGLVERLHVNRTRTRRAH